MVIIEGTIEEIIFHNETNGYTVCDVRHQDGEFTAVGFLPFVSEGETIRFTGSWVTHPDYGEQMKVENFEKILPKSSNAIEKYLASGIIKGIGPATAAKIVERFGDKALEIIQYNPSRLSEIRGISSDKAQRIGQAFSEQRELREVIMFFQQYGISVTYSARIYKTFGSQTIEMIKANPYRLADEIFGIGFKTADSIAMAMGVDPGSKFRLSSGIRYVLSQAANNGNTFLTEEQLRKSASGLLEVSLGDMDDVLAQLIFDKVVCTEEAEAGRRVYLSSFYNAEVGVCRKLLELTHADFTNYAGNMEQRIAQLEKEQDICLAGRQKEALEQALLNGVMVITGGPGTGKTTIIKGIIRLLGSEGCSVALAAPTGRAAKRMSEATGIEARTIHRLLEIGYSGEETEPVFAKNDTNPLDADAVIIDEMSMVDILLMNHLLKAMTPGKRLILVGDADQLPSVGPGNVLKDIIESGLVKTVKLSEIFRQAEESMIIVNAHRINRGEQPCLNLKDKDFFLVSRSRGEDIVKTVVDLCSRRLPDAYGYDTMKHIQVLTPTRKGIAGVGTLNSELQKVLNPGQRGKNEKPYRDFVFRESDRVMQIKNNYNLKWIKIGTDIYDGIGVFNGDMGIIQKIDDEEQKLQVLFDDDKLVEYDYAILDEIEPAYAVTIHKSQGSEFPVVIIPLLAGPQVLMTRNLLYTAVTRAKCMVVIVGAERVMCSMIDNCREAQRNSGLKDKLSLWRV